MPYGFNTFHYLERNRNSERACIRLYGARAIGNAHRKVPVYLLKPYVLTHPLHLGTTPRHIRDTPLAARAQCATWLTIG